MPRQDEAPPKTVLVVHDDPWMRVELTALLREAGYLVSLASNGFTGLRLASQLLPHAVVLDLLVPEVPGLVVLRELRRQPATSNVPVILVLPTLAESVPEVIEADRVVRMPIGGHELLAEIHTALS